MEMMIVDIEVEAEGKVVRGSHRKFDRFHGNWIPGEPPDVENFKVFLVKGNDRVEITKFLDEKQIEAIKNQMIDEALEAS